MAVIFAGFGVLAALVIGVGAMLYSDHRQQKRMAENGGRRY